MSFRWTRGIRSSSATALRSLHAPTSRWKGIGDISMRESNGVYSSKTKFRSMSMNNDVTSNMAGKSAFTVPTINPPTAHANCKKWVIFSDLHVKGASIDVCEDVLAQVHLEAQRRSAGIIFLGDFWHVRGALSVELLNRVLRALRKWEQPVIMIPGNHDQVTLGGKVHSLEPLLYAFRPEQILMINEPSVCMGALWIPYRREGAVMKGVLAEAGLRSDVSMVFCHADVRGAYMNDNMRSKEGLDISCFPKNLPIYSGHFHKPHTIAKGGSTLRYVGSPYQTSLSEAGQEKYLYCVEHAASVLPTASTSTHPSTGSDSSSSSSSGGCTQLWREIERWAVSIGPKIIKAHSPSDSIIANAKSGDRVVITVPVGQDYVAQKVRADLQERDIEAELLYEHNPLTRRRAVAMNLQGVNCNSSSNSSDSINGRVTGLGDVAGGEFGMDGSAGEGAGAAGAGELDVMKVEERNPLKIFETYMQQLDIGESAPSSNTSGTNSTSRTNADTESILDDFAPANQSMLSRQQLQEGVLSEGRSTLDRLIGSAGNEGSPLSSLSAMRNAVDGMVKELVLDKVTLSNFGPYGGVRAVEYPLSKRGLVLVRGQSADGTGADSNGAGKTTLAMSVLWGLTGSLDARMVGDSRSSDVTFDSVLSSASAAAAPKATRKRKTSATSTVNTTGESVFSVPAAVPNKLVAEVIVNGYINSLPFEIIRRRSARKAELHFSVNGTTLTTQAVKDTQALIDENLGIQGGLLQRCCFFGQHTHTLQSLLGLTDVKMKQELGALVDTSLWSAASQDVRSRERGIKTRLTELAVEDRMYRQELNRAEAAHQEANASVVLLQSELESALRRAQELPLSNISIAALSTDLENLQNERRNFADSVVGSLRDLCNVTKTQRDQALMEVDYVLNDLKIEVAKVNTSRNGVLQSISSLSKKKDALLPQDRNYTRQVEQLTATCTVLAHTLTGDAVVVTTPPIFELPALRSIHESALAELTAINLRIDTANVSVSRMKELNTTLNSLRAGNKLSHQHASPAEHDACPTCGQDMPSETRDRRISELSDTLKRLLNEKEILSVRAQTSRKLYDSAGALQKAVEAQASVQTRLNDINSEIQELNAALGDQSLQLAECQQKVKVEMELRISVEQQYKAQLIREESAVAAAEARVEEMTHAEVAMQAQIAEQREQQDKALAERTTASAQVTLAQDRVTTALNQLKIRAEAVASLNETLRGIDATRAELTEKSLVLERLVAVLGPRGVQNFVFQNVIAQLESITNSYLMVLAEGGIQLALQNTGEDEDKIVKSVWVRSRDSGGEYRERALAQLSGGQWRRVSLALDFAFAELIRRRGVLRSNLMVMDEVLTHLDASGRESVGTVLRAMVQGPVPTSTSDPATVPVRAERTLGIECEEESEQSAADMLDEFGVELPNAEELRMQQLTGALLGGGAYETVIVILQDLAAAELAEAFDHVDVVVKEKDSSVVVLDGVDL